MYISARRDGSIWIKVGLDGKAQDWIYRRETRVPFKVNLSLHNLRKNVSLVAYNNLLVSFFFLAQVTVLKPETTDMI